MEGFCDVTHTIFLEAFLATSVIKFPLVFVRKDLISCTKVCKLLVGVGVILIVVRMQFFGQLTIGLLDLVSVGTSADSQY